MPPLNRDENDRQLGWKAFFALLMLIQVIGVGILWRTYDAIQTTAAQSNLNQYKIDQVLTPRVERLERASGRPVAALPP